MLGLITRNISVRLPRTDLAWIEALARHNQVPVSAMIRALLHGMKMAAEDGRLEELDLGVLVLKV